MLLVLPNRSIVPLWEARNATGKEKDQTTACRSAVVNDYNDYMVKSEPVTVRLSSDLDEWVTSEARRTRRPKGTVIEALAKEALRARQFPGIAFRGDDWERRPWIVGTGLDVWEVVRSYRDVQSVEEVASGGNVTVPQIRLALAYYDHFPDEIDDFIERDRRPLEVLRASYPTIEMV
jgi:uncharacterized protein (DUF433 family)